MSAVTAEAEEPVPASQALAWALEALRASAEIGLDERGGFQMANVAVERVLGRLSDAQVRDVACAVVLLSRLADRPLSDVGELDRWACSLAWAFSDG